MTKFKDFWDLDVPQELLSLGFVDSSWHNDAAASMIHPVTDAHGNSLQVWVGSDATAEELGDENRYMIGYVQLDEDGCYMPGDTPDADELGLTFSTAHLPSFLAMVKAMMEAQAFELALHKAANLIVS